MQLSKGFAILYLLPQLVHLKLASTSVGFLGVKLCLRMHAAQILGCGAVLARGP